MSLESNLIAILAFTKLPCEQNAYHGAANKYLVFNITTIPADYADDEPHYERCLVMLHLFAPLNDNTTELKNAIKKAIFAAGYGYPQSTPASDASSQHIIFEFEALWPV